jgi:hypothetical protein
MTMTIYSAETFDIQHEHEASGSPGPSWIAQLLAAHRKRKAAKRLMASIRHMDRHMLNDIGLDQAALSQIYPGLAFLHRPSAPAPRMISGFHLPVDMSSR